MQSIAAQRPAAPAAPMPLKRWSVGALAALIALATLWFILCWQLSGEWSLNEQYNYGWFVPFFALYLFWLRWEDQPPLEIPNPKSQIRSHRVAAIIAALVGFAALLLFLPVRLFEIGNPDWRPLSWVHASIVATLTLLYVWHRGGTLWLRHFAFPILFIFVAVPWVTPIEVPVVQGLMQIVAAIASEIAALFGIPAHIEGNLIRIPGGLVGVNEACSGVRSLQTSLMIGLLFGELKRLSIFRRIVLVAVAGAIAFVGNCIRAFFLVWVAASQNLTAVGRWHDLAGYGIVVAVFIGTLVAAALLGRTKKEVSLWLGFQLGRAYSSERGAYGSEREQPPARRGLRPGGRSEISGQFRISAAALVWLIAVEFAAAGWYRAHEHDLARTARWEIQWPQNASNFHEIKIDDEKRRILRFDRGRAAAWTLPALNSTDAASWAARPLTCTLYFFRWNSGKNSALLASLHRPDVCLPAVGWNQTGDIGVKKYSVGPDLSLPFRHFEFRHGAGDESTQQVAHAFYCLWEDVVSPAAAKSQLPDMTTSPSEWTRDERIRAVLEGRRHLGQQVMELVIQGRGALDEKEMNARFETELPSLIKVEAQ